MKALLAAIGLLAVSSIGCNNLPKPGMSYTLQLDPNLSAEQSEAIITGSYAWSEAIPGLTFTYLVQSCQAMSHTVCISADSGTPRDDNGNRIDGHTDSVLIVDSSVIILHSGNLNIANSDCPNALLDTAQHELGHAVSFRGDHLAMGNLMQPALSCSQVVEKISISDVDYFWSQR